MVRPPSHAGRRFFQPVSECGRFVAEESKEVHRLKDQIKQLKSGAITLEELES